MSTPTRPRIHLPNPALVILVGLQGSGKSTLAYSNFAPIEILSMDDFRARMCNDPASQSNSAAARRQLLNVLHQRLRNRVTTIVDSTNLHSSQRIELLDLAREFGTPTVVLVLTAGPEHCRKRVSDRASIIGESVLTHGSWLLERALRDVDTEGYFAVIRLDNDHVESARFEHAVPDDADPGRWFEVEHLGVRRWIHREPVDELRRHSAVLTELRPSREFMARVAADIALEERGGPRGRRSEPRIGVAVQVRLPHCLPIDLVAGTNGWVRTPVHPGDS